MATRFVYQQGGYPEPDDQVVVTVDALPSGAYQVSYHRQTGPEQVTFTTEPKIESGLDRAKDRAMQLAEELGTHTVYLRGIDRA